MQAWTRTLAIALVVLSCGLLNLRAAEDAQPAAPKEIRLQLLQIAGSQTGKPACDEPLAFLKALLAKSFPQFDTFKLLLAPEEVLTREKNPLFTTGNFTTQVTLLEFVAAKNEDGKPIWKAKLKLECKTGDKVLYNPTIQILPGGQHIWAVDTTIFVLYLPVEKEAVKTP